MTDFFNEDKIPEKVYYVEYNAPIKSIIEEQTANFALILTCSALEGFPLIKDETGDYIQMYDDLHHFGFKITLPITYEKELEQTLIGTGFNIVNN